MPDPPVETLRKSHRATSRKGDPSATERELEANPEEQAYMAIILAALRRSTWKSRSEEQAMLLAVRAMSALSALAGKKRRDFSARALQNARNAQTEREQALEEIAA